MVGVVTATEFDELIQEAADVPCKARINKQKGRICGAPATHDVLLPCGPCGYLELREVCDRHAKSAARATWHCHICKTPIHHMIVRR